MIFLVLSSDPDVLPITRIKVPGRDPDDSPAVAFATNKVGQFFMKAHQIDEQQHRITGNDEAAKLTKMPRSILIFRSEQQVLDSLSYREGYDYESLIELNGMYR